MEMRDLTWRLVTVSILLVLLLTRTHRSAILGTQSDEGVHLVAAERVASGDVLYLDLFENRTPLVEWTLALFFKLIEPTIFLGRVLSQYSAVISAATLIAIIRVAAKYKEKYKNLTIGNGWIGGSAAAVFFALTPIAIFWGRFTMLEHWQTTFSLLAIGSAFYAEVSERKYLWLAAGLFAGLSVLSKQSALTVVAAISIYLIILSLRKHNRMILKPLIYWGAGILATVIILLIIFTVQGSLMSFGDFVSGAERLDLLANLPDKVEAWMMWSVRQPALLLAVIGLIAISLSGGNVLSIFVIWPLVEMFALFFPPEIDLDWGGFSHYVIPIVASLSLIGGFGFQYVIDNRHKKWMKYSLAAIIIIMLLMLVGWSSDLSFVLSESEYPMASNEAELEIGSIMRAFGSEPDPALVLANSVFYHHSGRKPASKFFHYPEFLPESDLRSASDADIIRSLESPDTSAVVVSRMHLEDRLTPEVKMALWDNWLPVAIFPYPYQRDVFIFGRPSEFAGSVLEPQAQFESGISLDNIETVLLNNDDLLVKLWWQTERKVAADLTVFTHVVGSDNLLISQNDSIPMVGFSPTSTWEVGQIIEDWHIIDLPEDTNLEDSYVRVGLYESGTGKNIMLINDQQPKGQAFEMELDY